MARSTKYEQIIEGEWSAWHRRNNREQCCDCGLVHIVDYKIEGSKILTRDYRDDVATATVRRNRRIKIARIRPR